VLNLAKKKRNNEVKFKEESIFLTDIYVKDDLTYQDRWKIKDHDLKLKYIIKRPILLGELKNKEIYL